MLARAEDPENDILFTGDDHNSEGFLAWKRQIDWTGRSLQIWNTVPVFLLSKHLVNQKKKQTIFCSEQDRVENNVGCWGTFLVWSIQLKKLKCLFYKYSNILWFNVWLTFTPALSPEILSSNNDEADDEAREDEDGHEIHDVCQSVSVWVWAEDPLIRWDRRPVQCRPVQCSVSWAC